MGLRLDTGPFNTDGALYFNSSIPFHLEFELCAVCPNVTTDGGLSVFMFSIQIAAGHERVLHQVILSDCFDVLVYHNKRNCTLSIWVN